MAMSKAEFLRVVRSQLGKGKRGKRKKGRLKRKTSLKGRGSYARQGRRDAKGRLMKATSTRAVERAVRHAGGGRGSYASVGPRDSKGRLMKSGAASRSSKARKAKAPGGMSEESKLLFQRWAAKVSPGKLAMQQTILTPSMLRAAIRHQEEYAKGLEREEVRGRKIPYIDI